ATTAHTRHYMPIVEGKNEKTTKIFDTFVQLADDTTILVAWEVNLPEAERTALKALAERLAYFGRAESLVEGRLSDGTTAIEANSAPLAEGEALPPNKELVRLLAPMTSGEYDAWQKDFHSNNPPPSTGKKKAGKKAKDEDGTRVPKDLFAALHADTGDLQVAGWNLPPGAQFLNYARPENAFASATKPHPRHVGPPPTVARFALTSVVPPAITKALAVAEQIHKVLCSKKISDCHPVFTGSGGKDHQHAHIFCESIDHSNAHITHVTVFAPGGFDRQAVEALRRMQWTWGFKGHDLRLVLHGIGQPHEFESPLFATKKSWCSLTPFVSTRHAKTYRDGRPKMDANGWQEGSAGHDLLRLLALHSHGSGATIKQLEERKYPYRFGERRFRSLQFQNIRTGGNGSRGHDSGAAFIITFPKPVNGPLALGYGSHFGLGLFQPVDDPETT
ncbi:MAG TPA: type I-U CRISPR-associated protein Csb2, partial [Verrucomicrobiae bacterium]|nr:type I-U CRISPR-associated protein Csb2 [Verrucomicrobiae bacterium]